MPYIFHSVLKTPRPVTALAFASSDALSVGSDDGSVRLYNLPSTAVVRAIRALGSEITSLCWATPPTEDDGELWVACGQKAMSFRPNAPDSQKKLVLNSQDASVSLDVVEGEDSEVNQLSISPSKQFIAFSTDDGDVCVVDLQSKTKKPQLMKTRHSSICACVSFVPDRPNELVSGGYDSALLHFDFKQGTLLSRFDIAPPDPPSMSMPFIISMSLSSTGVIAATLADGRIWVGTGGAKVIPTAKHKSKKSRKWEGLREAAGCYKEVASGPVVASAFTPDGISLISSSLLGKLAQHTITVEDEKAEIQTIWSGETKNLEKVSAIALSEKWLAVGGFGGDEKGLVEIWCRADDEVGSEGITTEMKQLSVSDIKT